MHFQSRSRWSSTLFHRPHLNLQILRVLVLVLHLSSFQFFLALSAYCTFSTFLFLFSTCKEPEGWLKTIPQNLWKSTSFHLSRQRFRKLLEPLARLNSLVPYPQWKSKMPRAPQATPFQDFIISMVVQAYLVNCINSKRDKGILRSSERNPVFAFPRFQSNLICVQNLYLKYVLHRFPTPSPFQVQSLCYLHLLVAAV